MKLFNLKIKFLYFFQIPHRVSGVRSVHHRSGAADQDLPRVPEPEAEEEREQGGQVHHDLPQMLLLVPREVPQVHQQKRVHHG